MIRSLGNIPPSGSRHLQWENIQATRGPGGRRKRGGARLNRIDVERESNRHWEVRNKSSSDEMSIKEQEWEEKEGRRKIKLACAINERETTR